MQTKLTLRLNQDLVAFGKRWAREHGKSLSALVSDYLATLERLAEQPQVDALPPLTKSLVGAARGADEEAYRKHLEAKHR